MLPPLPGRSASSRARADAVCHRPPSERKSTTISARSAATAARDGHDHDRRDVAAGEECRYHRHLARPDRFEPEYAAEHGARSIHRRHSSLGPPPPRAVTPSPRSIDTPMYACACYRDNMIRAQIHLEFDQYERLKAHAARRSKSFAKLVREGVGEGLLHRATAALLGASRRGVSPTDWPSFTIVRERGIGHAFAFDGDLGGGHWSSCPPVLRPRCRRPDFETW